MPRHRQIAVLFSLVLFPLANVNGRYHAAAGYEQQCKPKNHMAVITRLRRFGIISQFGNHGCGLCDFILCIRIREILAAVLAIPILNISLRVFRRRLRFDVLEVGMVVGVDLSILRHAVNPLSQDNLPFH